MAESSPDLTPPATGHEVGPPAAHPPPRMPNISRVLARVFVPDIDATVPFYEALAEATAERFSFRDVQLARVGNFLLLAGNTASFRDRTATVEVVDLAPVIAAVEHAGGQIIEGPTSAPNGDRLIVRHPDGAVFEYIQSGVRSPTSEPGVA